MTKPILMPDVSSNQRPVFTRDDCKQIARVGYALMIKATQGGSYTYEGFAASEANARKAGLETVAYGFVDTTASGVAQARHMWSVVERSGVSALCIDWEEADRQTALEMLQELRALARGSGRTVGAYEGSWAREHGGALPGCHFVIVPDYGVAALPDNYKLKPYAGWQYTDGVHNGTHMPDSIPGIGHCDVSIIERPHLIFGGEPKPRRKPRRQPWWKRHAW